MAEERVGEIVGVALNWLEFNPYVTLAVTILWVVGAAYYLWKHRPSEIGRNYWLRKILLISATVPVIALVTFVGAAYIVVMATVLGGWFAILQLMFDV